MSPPRTAAAEAPDVALDVTAFDGPIVEASMWPAINVDDRRVGMLVTDVDRAGVLWEIARRAEMVKVFHRHPPHVLPAVPLARPIAGLATVARAVSRWHLRLAIRDREMRRQLTPLGTRSVAVSNRWYRAMRRPNCELITWPVTAVSASGIRTADGLEHLVDMLVVA